MPPDLFSQASGFRTLVEVFAWAQSLTPRGELISVITQDEFTHDIVFRLSDLFLVFDTT
jgi:hypothetical protein